MSTLMASIQVLLLLVLFMVAAILGLDITWYDAHATFYGDMRGNETMKGACGYGDLFKQGYGLETTALSTALFDDGLACGACLEIVCVNSPRWCIRGAGSITVTATNFCPPDNTGLCNPPLKHFDLSKPLFTKLAPRKAGIIPVKYLRTHCKKQGGVKFEIKGNPYWIFILVYNVGGASDVTSVRIKGSRTGWISMSRNWGQNWQTGTVLTEQSLSFQVTTSDGAYIEINNVAPLNWQFSQTYDGRKNF